MILDRPRMITWSNIFLSLILLAFASTIVLAIPGMRRELEGFAQEPISSQHSALLPEGWARRTALISIMPSYPEEAIRLGISGIVFAKFETNPEGEVIRIKVKPETDALLSKAVADALKQWKFKPWPGSDGLGQTVFSRLAFRFTLSDGVPLVDWHNPKPKAPPPECLECSNSNREMNDWKNWKEVWSKPVGE